MPALDVVDMPREPRPKGGGEKNKKREVLAKCKVAVSLAAASPSCLASWPFWAPGPQTTSTGMTSLDTAGEAPNEPPNLPVTASDDNVAPSGNDAPIKWFNKVFAVGKLFMNKKVLGRYVYGCTHCRNSSCVKVTETFVAEATLVHWRRVQDWEEGDEEMSDEAYKEYRYWYKRLYDALYKSKHLCAPPPSVHKRPAAKGGRGRAQKRSRIDGGTKRANVDSMSTAPSPPAQVDPSGYTTPPPKCAEESLDEAVACVEAWLRAEPSFVSDFSLEEVFSSLPDDELLAAFDEAHHHLSDYASPPFEDVPPPLLGDLPPLLALDVLGPCLDASSGVMMCDLVDELDAMC